MKARGDPSESGQWGGSPEEGMHGLRLRAGAGAGKAGEWEADQEGLCAKSLK